MHYFESQLTSTIKCVREDAFKIIFQGHYRWGDGASTPGLLALLGLTCLLVAGRHDLLSQNTSYALTITAVGFFAATIALVAYEKTVVFDLQRQCILVHTLSLLGGRTMIYRPETSRLKVENIHIRLAENCGAVDLYLSAKKIIRLSVDGDFRMSQEKARRLTDATGITLLK